LAAAAFGLFIGAMPGLTATMATALLVPVTFFMDPVPAIGAIVTASAMAIFAGDIPATLLRMPGTPSSAAYVDDAYNLMRQGRAELALGIALFGSALGGLAGTVVLVTVAPVLAEFALNFSSYEYFWLACLGLICGAVISSGSPLKGVVSLLLGLLVATVGIDVITGIPRFTFGSVELTGGVGFIPVLIGMFALSEILRNAASLGRTAKPAEARAPRLSRELLAVFLQHRWQMLRGSALGTLVGALPGAGAGIAAWISYAVAKRFSRTPERFGSGHVEGLIEATASNNAALSGAWVPALVFGIPGDAITAIVIGVLFMQGLTPGPTVFIHSGPLVYALFIIFFLANLVMMPLGWLAIRWSRRVLAAPQAILLPIVLMCCIIGTYAINNSTFAVGVMLLFGVLAWFMEENGVPVAPAILGLVLGPTVEETFMVSMIKAKGDLLAFVGRPLAASLAAMTVAVILSPFLMRTFKSIHGRRQVREPQP
jgi:putative tricarboxylic transport membrane protein